MLLESLACGLTFLLGVYVLGFPNALTIGLALLARRNDIDSMLFGDDRIMTGTPVKLWAVREEKERAAWRIKYTTLVCILVLGYVHIYHTEKNVLIAQRDAARMQPVPYDCLDNHDWRTTSWAQAAHYTLYPSSIEETCATYLERTRQGIWPNPLRVLIDTVWVIPMRSIDRLSDGAANALVVFLDHFGLFLQAYLLTLLPFAVFLLFLYRQSILYTPLGWMVSLLKRPQAKVKPFVSHYE